MKLSTELGKRATGHTIYILDEPTTGLHFEDVRRLLYVLQRLVDAGNTMLVIEHNLDVIKSADWIVDLGPEGGSGGGWWSPKVPRSRLQRSPRATPGATSRRSSASRASAERASPMTDDGANTDDPWERNAGWWQDGFTDGADAEYEEQILPLARECLAGAARVLDVGTGEGQIAPGRAGRRGARGGGRSHDGATRRRPRAGRWRLLRPQQCRRAPVPRRHVRRGRRVPRLRAHRRSQPAIAEIARVLEPGGRFAFFLNHPLLQAPNSGWIIDHILEEQYWRIGPYLVEDVSMEELAPGVVLPFVHRPLSQYVNAMAATGCSSNAWKSRCRPKASWPGRPNTATPRRFRDCC